MHDFYITILPLLLNQKIWILLPPLGTCTFIIWYFPLTVHYISEQYIALFIPLHLSASYCISCTRYFENQDFRYQTYYLVILWLRAKEIRGLSNRKVMGKDFSWLKRRKYDERGFVLVCVFICTLCYLKHILGVRWAWKAVFRLPVSPQVSASTPEGSCDRKQRRGDVSCVHRRRTWMRVKTLLLHSGCLVI